VKALIDSAKCTGHGACADRCPSVFDIDDDGYGVVLGDGQVPAGDEGKAREAGSLCPENAISFED
jgi:ferredoxin